MTEDKARKRAVRRRMEKTGERYTAARKHVRKPKPRVAEPGSSDEAVRRGTGKDWDEWLAILDDWGATDRAHKEIAAHVQSEYDLSGWWAQSVTVGYERMRGLRAKHEGSEGFSVSASKTYPVDVDRLFGCFADAKGRNRWLEPGTLKVRTTQPGKSARFDFHDGTGRVHAYFTAKGAAKSSVQIQHERLADPDAVEQMRAFWKERLGRLGEVLQGG